MLKWNVLQLWKLKGEVAQVGFDAAVVLQRE